MAKFNYKAFDKSGKQISGIMEAINESHAQVLIDKMGLVPVSVTAWKPPGKMKFFWDDLFLTLSRKKPKVIDIIVFTREFVSLLNAGVPILSTLEALEKQVSSKSFREVLVEMGKDIEAGALLSEAMAKHPMTFSTLYVATVKGGETGGVLPEVLMRLARLMEHELETKRGIKSAVRYPIMVVVALVVAFIVLTVFVIPRFADLYAKFGKELPLPTRILIETNHIVRNYWFIAFPAVLAVAFLFIWYIHTEKGRWKWDKFRLWVPVFGPLFKKIYMSRFATMFGTLYKSGVPIIRALEIVSETVGNVVLSREILFIIQNVKEGKGISAPLKESKLFPPMVVQMIYVGEKTGSIDEMLEEVAVHYDTEAKYIIQNMTSLIEPMLIVGLGAIVLILALGVFLPMWNLIKLYR